MGGPRRDPLRGRPRQAQGRLYGLGRHPAPGGPARLIARRSCREQKPAIGVLVGVTSRCPPTPKEAALKRFLVLYNSAVPASEQMASATPEQAKVGMEAWMTWVQKA